MVDCNADILHDVYSLSEAATMVDPKDTRNVIPELPSNFDEYTIYNAFMTYCNYGKHKGLKAATASAASAESAKKKKSASIKAKEKAKAVATSGEASGEAVVKGKKEKGKKEKGKQKKQEKQKNQHQYPTISIKFVNSETLLERIGIYSTF